MSVFSPTAWMEPLREAFGLDPEDDIAAAFLNNLGNHPKQGDTFPANPPPGCPFFHTGLEETFWWYPAPISQWLGGNMVESFGFSGRLRRNQYPRMAGNVPMSVSRGIFKPYPLFLRTLTGDWMENASGRFQLLTGGLTLVNIDFTAANIFSSIGLNVRVEANQPISLKLVQLTGVSSIRFSNFSLTYRQIGE